MSRSVLCHIIFVICVYCSVFLFLYDDPRVSDEATFDELKALNLDKETFKFRVARYNQYLKNEPFRYGPGEQGRGVHLRLSNSEVENLIRTDGYNSVACEKIALDRALGNRPESECLAVRYPENLPTASVVIIFYNEPRRLILRTVFSVVNRSPPKFLHEVILVDDGSTQEDLLVPLETFVSETWPDGIVHVIRAPERLGLIRARNFGAKAATGDVLIFLDAHCEATRLWLEPLLYRIQIKPTAVVCPAIPNIDKFTLTLFRSDVRRTEEFGNLKLRVGTFSWDGFFTFEQPKKHVILERRDASEPLKSITMAGGLFAMRRDYFFELGAYDAGMEVWGGENIELSFRVWQCGGSVEFSPCSTVGHVYRSNHPYKFPGHKDYFGINTVRLAEVWMDQYKELFYLARPDLRNVDYGDISDRLELRKRLNCKSFDWFLQGPAAHKFTYSKDTIGYGTICSAGNPAYCLLRDPSNQEIHKEATALLLSPHNSTSWAKLFALTKTGLIRKDWVCVQLRRRTEFWVFSERFVDLAPCPDDFDDPHEASWWRAWVVDRTSGLSAFQTTSRSGANFRWVSGQLINAETGECLDSDDGKVPIPRQCANGSPTQIWRFSHPVLAR